MEMDLSSGVPAGPMEPAPQPTPIARSASVVGELAAEPSDSTIDPLSTPTSTTAEPAEDAETDASEPEFWDACWTLEDEWQPRATTPARRKQRRPAKAAGTEVRALL